MAGRTGWWFGKLIPFHRWIARWRVVISQWSDVEAGMAMHYQLTTEDIFSMSWRRFVILFESVFNWNDEEDDTEGSLPPEYAKGGVKRSHWEQVVHEARGATGEIQRSIDWDGLQGRAKPDTHQFITTGELLEGME